MTFQNTKIKKVFKWDVQVRPEPYWWNELCFTANTVWSTIQLYKIWSPTAVTLEISIDGTNWTTYTIWDIITIGNIWDKVWFRNASTSTTQFSLSWSNYYRFAISGEVSASWDITYLLNKNGTNNLIGTYTFLNLFRYGNSLITPPSLPATWLVYWCYMNMFYGCSKLEVLPKLPATTMPDYCYNSMFYDCSKIKLSATHTWEYQTSYRIPTTWTWTADSRSVDGMFYGTWWTFTWAPTVNTTYYTSNTVV
jgi:hypothetical protein